jgi:exonuclease SbcC
MRILGIRLRNLNSLVGEWEIDLTHPAYAGDGIFAITGPTGAGKTTILDAVCLAIYGRTPRLNRISQSTNEIMSRRRGECMAEVVFESGGRTFRCHWGQQRARGRADGGLQAPRHEFADGISGDILADGLRNTAERIEKECGMNFEQFTRSMLLAQGNFAKFLQAGPDERAPILERISGTDIYSRISARVHERRSLERARLEDMENALAGLCPLDAEEEQALKRALERNAELERELCAEAEEKERAVAWLLALTALENDLRVLDEQMLEWERKMLDFAPDRERLLWAERAFEAEPVFSVLLSLRAQQEEGSRRLAGEKDLLPALEAAAAKAEADSGVALAALEEKRAQRQDARPLLDRARVLDALLAQCEAGVQAGERAVLENRELQAGLAQEHEAALALMRKTGAAHERLRETADAADADLQEKFPVLSERLEYLRTRRADWEARQAAVLEAEREFAEVTVAASERAVSLELAKSALEDGRAALEAGRAELEKTLEGRETAQWRETAERCAARAQVLGKGGDLARELLRARELFCALVTRGEGLEAELQDLQGRIAAQLEREAALERESALLARIAGLEEERLKLLSGEPCPLCGALEHPFAAMPAGESVREAREARETLKEAGDLLDALRVRRAEAGKELEQTGAFRLERIGEIAAKRGLLLEVFQEQEKEIREGGEIVTEWEIRAAFPEPGREEGSGFAGRGEVFLSRLGRLREDAERALELARQRVKTAEALERKAGVLKESLGRLKESLAGAEREALAASLRRDAAEAALERLRREAAESEAHARASLDGLRGDLDFFGFNDFSGENAGAVLENLRGRRDAWLESQREKERLERELAGLAARMAGLEERRTRAREEGEKNAARLAEVLREKEGLVNERRAIFGGRGADAEEKRLELEELEAGKAVELAAGRSGQARRDLERLRAGIAEQAAIIAGRARSVEADEKKFLSRIKEYGFADEKSYVACRLPDEQRRVLAALARSLDAENAGAQAAHREKSADIARMRGKMLTGKNLTEVKGELELLREKQRRTQQESGGIAKTLRDNDDLLLRRRGQAEALALCRRECARWDDLHALIGSADGKKYRNYVQGLTFEMMMGVANLQLRKMSDRYLLSRDRDQPLGLNVLDNWQAGEIRSSRNLSGGESFIVSLALALGLAEMSGERGGVDSLFLDEGFGSLDEEALDTALDTLAGLKRDGKLIGIISHVPALQERIGVRIEVVPLRGGQSRISGPGCRGG